MPKNLTSSEKARHKYYGEHDDNNLRHNNGCEIWYGDYFQKYTGQFLHNNLHGSGFYFLEMGEERYFYDGLFYANNLHSYCQIFYGNGTNFQGLFKNNKRFGPGIATQVDGCQNVGLWHEDSLIRLAITIEPELVPRLAKTTLGKIKLLKYKDLVPVCEVDSGKATKVLQFLQANETVLAQSQTLYNFEVRTLNSIFFNKIEHDKAFYGDKTDCTIEVFQEEAKEEVTEEEEAELAVDTKPSRYKQILHQLEKVEKKLNQLKCFKEYMTTQLHYCKTCCYDGEDNEAVNSDIEEKVEGEEIPCPCICSQIEIGGIEELKLKQASIIKEELFYSSIKTGLNLKLNQEETRKKQLQPIKTTKIYVTDLVSWNNEPIFKNMLKHCFHNRKLENLITFNAAALIAGERNEFGNPGEYEVNCRSFLAKCSGDSIKDVSEILLKFNINPDLSDAKGNTGLIFASSKDNIKVMGLLIDSGAKVDIVNDEGLTPLTLCLLRYLAVKNDSRNWENSFLPEISMQVEEKTEVMHWRPHQSLLSLGNASYKESQFNFSSTELEKSAGKRNLGFSNHQLTGVFEKLQNLYLSNKIDIPIATTSDKYVFGTDFVKPVIAATTKEPKKVKKDQKKGKKGKKGKDKKSRRTKTETLKKTSILLPPSDDASIERESKKLVVIHGTIITLLNYGADPNIGEVPLPPLILSLFTENPEIVEQILQSQAMPNVIHPEENLSCLHIIASLPPSLENIKICKILLQYDCDPNLKTSLEHWHEQKMEILGQGVDETKVEDVGKNALQLLCLRKDFEMDHFDYFGSLAKDLVKYKVNLQELYLGHTPLTLAVLTGNLKLIQALLETKRIDPYQVLGYNMGNALTVLILKRYANVLPLEKGKQVLDLLVNLKVNPLQKIEHFENVVEFMEEEHKKMKNKKVGKKGKKDKKKTKDKKGKKEKSTKSGKKGKGSKKSAKKSKPTKTTKSKTTKSKSSKSKTTKSKSTKSGKSSKSKKGSKRSPQAKLMLYMKELSRKTIIRQVQMKITKALYDLAEEGLLENELVLILASFLTPEEALENLITLFQNRKIKQKRLNLATCQALLEFLHLHKIVKPSKRKKGKKKGKGSKSGSSKKSSKSSKSKKSPKAKTSKASKTSKKSSKSKKSPKSKKSKTSSGTTKSTKSSKKKSKKNKKGKEPPEEPDFQTIVYNTNFAPIKSYKHKTKIKLLQPGLDSKAKYEICFQCLKKKDKKLYLCPKCNFIYFCSNQCNQDNLKLSTGHRCDLLFYNDVEKLEEDQKEDAETSPVTNKLVELIENAAKHCEEQLQLRKEQFLKIQKEILEAEKKADVYGTRNLKTRNLEKFYDQFVQMRDVDESDSNKSSVFRMTTIDGRSPKLSSFFDLVSSIFSEKSSAASCSASEERFQATLYNENLVGYPRAKETVACECPVEGVPAVCKPKKSTKKSSVAKKREVKSTVVVKRKRSDTVLKKTRKIPVKYQYFIELLHRFFPETDFSSLFLPYACYTGGQLYYKFSGLDLFAQTYSVS